MNWRIWQIRTWRRRMAASYAKWQLEIARTRTKMSGKHAPPPYRSTHLYALCVNWPLGNDQAFLLPGSLGVQKQVSPVPKLGRGEVATWLCLPDWLSVADHARKKQHGCSAMISCWMEDSR
jgi:hypothetical protein